MKSLLRFGSASTRFKDVYDMYYLLRRMRKTILRSYLKLYIFDDLKQRENNMDDVLRQLRRTFSNHRYMEQLSNPIYAWIEEDSNVVVKRIMEFLVNASV